MGYLSERLNIDRYDLQYIKLSPDQRHILHLILFLLDLEIIKPSVAIEAGANRNSKFYRKVVAE